MISLSQSLGNPHQPAIMFIHGFMGRGTDWLPVAQQLSGQYYCVLVDLPGHGDNLQLSKTRPLSFEQLTEGLRQLCDSEHLASPIVIGYSLGGRIALSIALSMGVGDPQRVRALVIENANPGIRDTQARQDRATLDDQRAAFILENGLDEFVDRWYTMPLFKGISNGLEQMKMRRKENDAGWMAKVISELSPGRMTEMWGALPELPMPILLIGGEKDTKYRAVLHQMAALIPKCTLETVSGAGHNVHFERGEAFAGLVKKWLGTLGFD